MRNIQHPSNYGELGNTAIGACFQGGGLVFNIGKSGTVLKTINISEDKTMAQVSLKEIVQYLAACNDSYEDILWISLNCILSKANDITVEEWLRALAAEYGKE
jgi:hypothetical protein